MELTGWFQMSHPRLLIFIDADVVVRHFLDSGTFSALSNSYEVILVFPPPDWQRLVNSQNIDGWGFRARRVKIPQRRRTLFKQLFFIDQAKHRRDREWQDIRNAWITMVGWKASMLFSLLALPLVRQLANACIMRQLNATPATEFLALLDDERPDILLHPSTFEGYFINDLIGVAHTRNIPLMLLMNSWDNPCLKRSTIGVPDAVVVWGEQTRRHTEKFMAVPPEKIHVLGSAQFQVFRDAPVRTREEVCAINGIDSKQHVLLYAGSSKGNREPVHLRWLNDAIKSGLLEGVTVLYRPHPYGIDAVDAQIILNQRLPHVIIENSMVAFLEDVANSRNRGFHMTPYRDTHDLLNAVDAVISPLSTILIEAGLHGKPFMCFIPKEEDENSVWGVLRNLVHFRELLEHPSAIVAHSYSEFIPAAQILISRTRKEAETINMKKLMSFFVEFPIPRYSLAIKDLADSLIRSKITQ
jgi:hypothetical protein